MVLLAAALAAVAAACSSPPADELPVPELLAQTPTESPLDAAWTRIYGANGVDPLDSERDFLDQQTITETYVAECMGEQGFEYIPFVPAREAEVPTGSHEPPDAAETLEQARLTGYGIVEDSRAAAEQVVGERPNDVLRAALSSSERAAYDLVLDGFERDVDDQLVFDESGNTVTLPGAGETCRERANDHLNEVRPPTPSALSSDPVYIELTEASGEVTDRMSGDRRMTDLNGEWSTCMADAGYSGLVEPFEAWALASEAWSAWMNENAAPDGTLPLDDPEVARLEQREITIAVDDATCQLSTTYSDRFTAIRYAYEQQVVDLYADDFIYLEQAWARGTDG
ncbi:hypothetical protein SERN_1285 [Serinibacter arcticus]|uniref:Lipoprotein n=2 Tax=Serinibacter arcticus TaxID=1655435 RepID=A0A4Z1E6R7_9MICO|nr:hypothetical protein SERN_1285 [Serinibacter arcticus]